jgi:hypothetical protein
MQLLALAWWFIFNKNDRVFASIREKAAQAQHGPPKLGGANGSTEALATNDTELATRC